MSLLGLLVFTCVGWLTGTDFLWSDCAIGYFTGHIGCNCAINCDTDCVDCKFFPLGV